MVGGRARETEGLIWKGSCDVTAVTSHLYGSWHPRSCRLVDRQYAPWKVDDLTRRFQVHVSERIKYLN
ncbi:unnamed protein product [Nesidiocoris tenuis]|nr:unnamed protein product [Nesidiocoris tenuis]